MILWVPRLYIVNWCNDRWTGKDSEGSGSGIIRVLPRNLSGGMRKPRKISLKVVIVPARFESRKLILLSHIWSMWKHSGYEENTSGDFDCFKHIQTPVCEQVFSGILSMCMCTLAVPERLDRFCSYLVLKNLPTITLYLVNMIIVNSKNRVISGRTQETKLTFSEKWL